MTRILWLLRYAPVLEERGGDAIYSRELLRHTARCARVTALSFATDARLRPADALWDGIDWELAEGAALRPNALSLLSTMPSIAYRHTSPTFIARVVEAASQTDAVILDHIGLVFLVDHLRRALGARCPALILLFHDHGATLRSRMAAHAPNLGMRALLTLDGLKAARMERRAARRADGLTAIATTDLRAFGRDAPSTPSIYLPPGYDGPRRHFRRIDASTPARIVILGGRTSFHKQLVLRRILDQITAAGLQRRLTIDVVGGEPDPEAGRRYPGVNFLGFIDDLNAYMDTVRLGLIPDDVGGGFKLRALTHLFLRVPMLALSEALAGMELRPDVDFLACRDIPGLVAAIPAAVADVARLDRIQNAAYDAHAGKYDWALRGQAVAEFAARLARGRAVPSAAIRAARLRRRSLPTES